MVKQHVEIGGEERPVLFSIHALREIERLVPGYYVLDGKTAAALASLDAIIALVYAGCKWGLYNGNGLEPKPRFTLLEVGDWVEKEGVQEGSPVDKITKLFLDSFPKLVKNAVAVQGTASQESGTLLKV